MNISNRSWKRCVAPSSPSCTRVLEECLEVCPVGCQETSLERLVLLQVEDPLGQLLRRSINLWHLQQILYTTGKMNKHEHDHKYDCTMD